MPTDVCATQSDVAVMVTSVLVVFVTVAPLGSYWKSIPDTDAACTTVGATYSTAASSALPKNDSFFNFPSFIEHIDGGFAVIMELAQQVHRFLWL
jgi:hypothetical protein